MAKAKDTVFTQAYAAGQKAKREAAGVTTCPHQGNVSGSDATDETKVGAFKRDCWFAGYYGEKMPDRPRWLPASVEV